jgi:hypothetical protein
MSIYLRVILAGALVILGQCWAARPASAWTFGAYLAYAWDTDEIYGYADTGIEPWDDTYSYECYEWDFDPWTEEEICISGVFYQYVPGVGATLYDPSPAFYLDISNVGTGDLVYVDYALNPPYLGTWTQISDHVQAAEVWSFEFDYYSGDYNWEYLGASAFLMAQLGAQASNSCNNPDVDAIVTEYRVQTPRVEYIPGCGDFRYYVDGENSTYFGWSDFANEHDYNGYYAIIASVLESGVDAIQDAWYNLGNGTIYSTSGYRNPVHNREHITPAGAANGRHIYGDAMDLASNASNWQDMWNTATSQSPRPCAEPQILSGTGHVHVDYRAVEGVLNPQGPCPATW